MCVLRALQLQLSAAILWSALSGIKSNLLDYKIEPTRGEGEGRKWRDKSLVVACHLYLQTQPWTGDVQCNDAICIKHYYRSVLWFGKHPSHRLADSESATQLTSQQLHVVTA